jgi:hypothetical protein
MNVKRAKSSLFFPAPLVFPLSWETVKFCTVTTPSVSWPFTIAFDMTIKVKDVALNDKDAFLMSSLLIVKFWTVFPTVVEMLATGTWSSSDASTRYGLNSSTVPPRVKVKETGMVEVLAESRTFWSVDGERKFTVSQRTVEKRDKKEKIVEAFMVGKYLTFLQSITLE